MYTSLCNDDVLFTREFVDESAGMYPCYYYRADAGLYVSTSVVRLIHHKGTFILNRNFKPGPWKLREPKPLAASLFRGRFLHRFTRKKQPVCDWYNTHETIDGEVCKVRPFERVTFGDSTIMPQPQGACISDAEFVEKTALYVQKFINDIETEYPEHNHIVLTGGKDSQLILLADKRNAARWNVFSSEPNAPLVKQWISDNGISINRIYEHDGRNEETGADLSEKIAAGDLFSNPRHMRWLPTLKRIGAELVGGCFFWVGTLGDTLMAFHKSYHRGSLNDFFDMQCTRGAAWQGNAHQVHKNFTGCACLSPYHSKEIWDNVFFKYDYAGMREGTDFRGRIGEALAGRTMSWPDSNPSPPLYMYEKDVDLYRHYVRCIRATLSEKA